MTGKMEVTLTGMWKVQIQGRKSLQRRCCLKCQETLSGDVRNAVEGKFLESWGGNKRQEFMKGLFVSRKEVKSEFGLWCAGLGR